MKPGPKKTEPFNLEAFKTMLAGLSHGKKRTAGTGLLYEQFRPALSRAELAFRIQEARRACGERRQSHGYRVEWLTPGLVWAMDDSDHTRREGVEIIRDAASRYILSPIAGNGFPGRVVRNHLERRFEENGGAPLMIKLDNAPNFLNDEMEDLFDEWGVIPLVSPAYCPEYNGGIENAQGEVKTWIRKNKFFYPNVPLSVLVVMAAGELNHRVRPVLDGKMACNVFSTRTVAEDFDKQRRKEVRVWIEMEACVILWQSREAGHAVSPATARRRAVRNWLVTNGHIIITPVVKSVTLFPKKKIS